MDYPAKGETYFYLTLITAKLAALKLPNITMQTVALLF